MEGLYILNMKGDVLITRLFRDTVPPRAANTFRINVVCAKAVRSPVLTLHGTTYIHTRQEDVYLLGVTQANCDVLLVLETLFRIVRQFAEIFLKPLNEQNLRSHFAFMYEMM